MTAGRLIELYPASASSLIAAFIRRQGNKHLPISLPDTIELGLYDVARYVMGCSFGYGPGIRVDSPVGPLAAIGVDISS